MGSAGCLFVWVFVVLLTVCSCIPQSLDQIIYSSLGESRWCTLLLTVNGLAGCQNERGNFGLLRTADSQLRLDRLLSQETQPFALVLPANLLSHSNLVACKSAPKLVALLVLNGPPPQTGWSPEAKVPQSFYDLHRAAAFEWNPTGDDSLSLSLPYHFLFLSESESTFVLEVCKLVWGSSNLTFIAES